MNNLAVISVIALALAILVSCVTTLNVGVLAIAMAWIVGVYIGNIPLNTVIAGFPTPLFLTLVVLNLIGAFQALGTLLGVGLMMVPAAAARFWARDVWSLAVASSGLALGASYAGLVVSYHLNLPSGPVIILAAGLAYVGSILFGRRDSLRARYLSRAHLRA